MNTIKRLRSVCVCIRTSTLFLILVLAACNSNPSPPSRGPSTSGVTVTGTVRYKNQPVIYGFVQFFDKDSIDPKIAKMYPISAGFIGRDGTYTAENVPVGKDLHIAVACDPNKAPRELSGLSTGVNMFPGAENLDPLSRERDKQPPPKLPPGMPPGKARPQPGRPGIPPLTGEQKTFLEEVHKQFSSPMVSGQFHRFESSQSTTLDLQLIPPKKK